MQTRQIERERERERVKKKERKKERKKVRKKDKTESCIISRFLKLKLLFFNYCRNENTFLYIFD